MDELPPPKVELTDVLQMLEAETRRRVIRFLNQAREEGFVLKVVSGYRSWERQDELYRKGRDLPGHKVTWVRGGNSWHNYGRAIDVAVVVNGELKWEWNYEKLWRIGEQCGLEAPLNLRGKDQGHFQFRDGMTIKQLRAAAIRKKMEEEDD